MNREKSATAEHLDLARAPAPLDVALSLQRHEEIVDGVRLDPSEVGADLSDGRGPPVPLDPLLDGEEAVTLTWRCVDHAHHSPILSCLGSISTCLARSGRRMCSGVSRRIRRLPPSP